MGHKAAGRAKSGRIRQSRPAFDAEVMAQVERMADPPRVRSLAHALEILVVEALEARGWKRTKRTT